MDGRLCHVKQQQLEPSLRRYPYILGLPCNTKSKLQACQVMSWVLLPMTSSCLYVAQALNFQTSADQ